MHPALQVLDGRLAGGCGRVLGRPKGHVRLSRLLTIAKPSKELMWLLLPNLVELRG